MKDNDAIKKRIDKNYQLSHDELEKYRLQLGEEGKNMSLDELKEAAAEEIFEDAKRQLDRLGEGKTDELDYISVYEMTDNGLCTGVRGAKIISDDLLYLDEEKTKPRIVVEAPNKLLYYSGSFITSTGFQDDKSNVIFYINEGEKLSNLLTQLPHGLVDKKATGIGATTLEIKSKRNSIIVVPTIKLAAQKVDKENKEYDKDVCLYVGSRETRHSTSEKEINDYLDDTEIKHKKIIVVADSLKKVIETIEKRGENVYRDYFLMVDEIDMLQSDGHFRDNLEKVIDYYLKFKIQRRCLVSATVKEFSSPHLQKEQNQCLTTIKYWEAPKRNIKVKHTNNIHRAVSEEITNRLKTNQDEKILVAYNQIRGIQKIISLLDKETIKKCKILCAIASKENVGKDFYTELTTEDKLKDDCLVAFMTCSYFAGIDIYDKCHLITVSNTEIPYTVLPLNKITQIHGRCRNGILSDTIIQNSEKKEMKGFKNIDEYKKHLFYKSDKVIEFMKAAKPIIKDDKYLEDLFADIEDAIIGKANETLYSQAIYKLVRRNAFDKSIIQRAYFNIDALCEKMIAYTTLYSDKEGLYKALEDLKNIVDYENIFIELSDEQKEKEAVVEEDRKLLIENLIKDAKDEIILARDLGNFDHKINILDLNAPRDLEYFYKSVKKFYPYIELEALMDKLGKVANKNVKAQKNMNNSIAFFALDKEHNFKVLMLDKFKEKQKYDSATIFKDLGLIFQTIKLEFVKTPSSAVEIFNCFFDTTYTQGKYRIKGTNPLGLPEPLETIPKEKIKLIDLKNIFDFS